MRHRNVPDEITCLAIFCLRLLTQTMLTKVALTLFWFEFPFMRYMGLICEERPGTGPPPLGAYGSWTMR